MADFILAAFLISGTLTFISFTVRTLFEVLKMSKDYEIASVIAEKMQNVDCAEFTVAHSDEKDAEDTKSDGEK